MTLLWTVFPIEQVLQTEPAIDIRELEVRVSGVKALAEKDSSGGYRLKRLLSTDPNDFLRPEMQPGQAVKVCPADENDAHRIENL